MPGDATYTTKAALASYTDAELPATDAAITALLERAERDVDSYLAACYRWGDSLLLFGNPAIDNPQRLTPAQARGLSRVTCARAEFLLVSGGSAALAAAQAESVKGPDFARTGKTDDVGPKVRRELWASGLVPTGARVGV